MTQDEIETYIQHHTSSSELVSSPVWAVYQPDTWHYGSMGRSYATRAQAAARLLEYGRSVACVVCVDAADHTTERVRIAPLLRGSGQRYIELARPPIGSNDWRWDVPSANQGQHIVVAYSNGVGSRLEASEGSRYKRVTDRSIEPNSIGYATYYISAKG